MLLVGNVLSWICFLYALKHFLPLRCFCFSHSPHCIWLVHASKLSYAFLYAFRWLSSLLNFPFKMHQSSFVAFSWPRSLLNMPFICIISLFYPLYDFSWPHSLLNLPAVCIKAILNPLHAFSWPWSSLNSICICIKAFLFPLYALSWPQSPLCMDQRYFVPFICLQ